MFGAAPKLDEDAQRGVLRECYGVEAARLDALPSERDLNVLVTPAAGGARLVLKVANAGEDRAHLEAQDAMLAQLQPLEAVPRSMGLAASPRCPGHALRLVTYAEGQPLATLAPAALHRPLWAALGNLVGRTACLLRPFEHPALHRPEFPWDLARYHAVVSRFLPAIVDEPFRALVERVFAVAHAMVQPLCPRFTSQALHNDLNTRNIIVGEREAITLIDFGDALHSWTVCEVAILAAYAFLLEGLPLGPTELCEELLRGYERSVQLLPEERAAVFPLAALRLCTSAVITASQSAADPHNAHVTVYQAHVQRALPQLLAELQAAVPPVPRAAGSLAYRLGCLADEPLWLAAVQEVLALEGTVAWSEQQAALQRQQWREAVVRGGATLAVDGAGLVAGLVTWQRGCVQPFAPPPAHPAAPYLWVAVSVARAMYQEVARLARDHHGVDDVQLDVYEQNSSSIAFHEKIGFRKYAVVVRRALGAAAAVPAELQFSPYEATRDAETRALELDVAELEARRPGSVTVVRGADGRLCAVYCACVSHEHPFGISYGRYEYPFVFLEALYVLPEHRGRGVGRAVLERLQAVARDQGCAWLLAGLHLQQHADLAAFLAHLGFAPYVHIFRMQ